MYTTDSIDVLIHLVRQGDRAALSELINRKCNLIQEMAAKTLYRSYQSSGAAESQTQNIVLALLQKLCGYPIESEKHFENLIWQIARRLMTDRARRDSLRHTESLDPEVDEAFSINLEACPIRPLLMQEILDEIDGLPTRQKIIVQYWLDGLTHARIAQHLEIGEDAVDGEIRKAKKLLGFEDIRIAKKRSPQKLGSLANSPVDANVGFSSRSNVIAAAVANAAEDSALEGQRQLLDNLDLAGGRELVPGVVLVEPLGRGGCGLVWKVLARGVPKALKLVPQFETSQLREAEILGSLHWYHPHLVRGYFIGSFANCFLFLMELADESLRGRLNNFRALGKNYVPLQEALAYTAQVAFALDFLSHARRENRFVHRDVKPDNILLFGTTAKLTDFGLSQDVFVDFKSPTMRLTREYAAPEVLEGLATVNSDQFSLAVTYCELRAGRRPFLSECEVRRGTPDLTMLSRAEQPVVGRALAFNFRARWRSCQEFVRELHKATCCEFAYPKPTEPEIHREARSSWSQWRGFCRPLLISHEDEHFLGFRRKNSKTVAVFRDSVKGVYQVEFPKCLDYGCYKAELDGRLGIDTRVGSMQRVMGESVTSGHGYDWYIFGYRPDEVDCGYPYDDVVE